jgi:dihydroflavonol-4-reductase
VGGDVKHCTVTGANGFLGSNVVRSLLARDYQVTALAGPRMGRENLDGLPVEIRDLDLLDQDSVTRALDGGSHLIHTAADYSFWYRDPRSAYRVNLEGTSNVLAAARELGYEKIVHTSTASTLSPVFGSCNGNGGGPENAVTDLRRFGGHYKTSKIMAELAATRFAAEGLPVVVVNPTIVLGAGDRRPTPTGSMIVHYINGRMKVYLDMSQNVVDVEDVADGHVLALERGRPGQRYVLGGENLSMAQVFAHLAEITGIPAPRIVLPRRLLQVLGCVDEWLARHVFSHEPFFPVEASYHARDSCHVSSKKAREELGYAPRPARSVLTRAVQWFVSQGFCSTRRRQQIEGRGALPTSAQQV